VKEEKIQHPVFFVISFNIKARHIGRCQVVAKHHVTLQYMLIFYLC